MAGSVPENKRVWYRKWLDSCEIRADRVDEATNVVRRILENRDVYSRVSAETPNRAPWWWIALVHHMERDLSFRHHLHNGDDIRYPTRLKPSGRPPGWTLAQGKSPDAWVISAVDALRYDKIHEWGDWSEEGCLYKWECYNGLGYWSKTVRESMGLGDAPMPSPYLFSGTNLYTRGKFRENESGAWFDPKAVSKQLGIVPVYLRLRHAERVGVPPIDGKPLPAPPPVQYGEKSDRVVQLQRMLNLQPGVYVHVDGKAGVKTSDAFKTVFGHYLPGDSGRRG